MPEDRDVGHTTKKEPELPDLSKIRAEDRQLHIARAQEAGLTREQAEKHADEHLGERVDQFD